MIDSYSRGLTLAAAIGAGITAGVYFAFSTFIMTGLRRLTHSQSIAAMNAINKAAPNPLFMLTLFGTAIVCVLLAISGFRHRSDPATVWLLAGCALYIVSVLVTVAYHIPRNDELMKIDPNSAGAAAAWSHFVTPWMAWNHVRALTAIGGTASFVFALRAS
jgi:uncharacterized membrane protein